MQQIQKSRQSSEAKRKALLTKSAHIRTEAEQLGVEPQLLETLDKTEQNIKLARVYVRKYRDFLKYENNQLDTLQEKLNTIKETNQKNYIEDMKASVFTRVLICTPNILISKLYYLALVPRNIPTSSAYIYMAAGDILFYTWIFTCVLYCIAYSYITINYIIPFIEKYPSLKIPTKFCSASTFLFLYGQLLFWSASLTPKLISPSWGPSIVNIVNLLITVFTSSPITAVLALITLIPIAGSILKRYKKTLLPNRPSKHKKRLLSTIIKRISENKLPVKNGMNKPT
jgi:hypothetical protein